MTWNHSANCPLCEGRSQISCYCSHLDIIIITIDKRKHHFSAKLMMEKQKTKQELNKSGSSFDFHSMISILCGSNSSKINEVGLCWRESWLLCFYIHVLEVFFFFDVKDFIEHHQPFKGGAKITITKLQNTDYHHWLLFSLYGCSAYRNKRQYQVSQTECVAQRVSLLLHLVVAVRGRFPGRPVLAAFILQTTTRQTVESDD